MKNLKKTEKKILPAFACMVLSLCLFVLPCFASAREASFTGVVSSMFTHTVFAPIGGTVDEVMFEEGQFADEESTLLSLKATPVYATESGTVHFFGDVGDSCENVTAKYGAVAYVEPDDKFTISCSTRSAYDSDENKWIVPGENVYLRSTQNSAKTGKGFVTAVTGTNYTVIVTDCGNLAINDTVNIFRSEDYAASSRIGRSTLTKVDPTGYTGEGSFVKAGAADGSHVEKGDVLFETLPGTFDGFYCTKDKISVPEGAVVSTVYVKTGDVVAKDQALAEYWMEDDICIEATVSESDLPYLDIGGKADVEFASAFLNPVSITATVSSISMVGTDGEDDEALYTVKLTLDEDQDTSILRYGMHCTVTTLSSEN